jgi:hypothetical protein
VNKEKIAMLMRYSLQHSFGESIESQGQLGSDTRSLPVTKHPAENGLPLRFRTYRLLLAQVGFVDFQLSCGTQVRKLFPQVSTQFTLLVVCAH